MFMTLCIYRYIHTTTLCYWPNTTGMTHFKIWQEYRLLYAKTCGHLRYLPECFLECFKTKVAEKMKRYFMLIYFSPSILPFMRWKDNKDCVCVCVCVCVCGIESRCGARYSLPVQTSPGAHPASCTMVTESFPGVKRPGAWRWPPTPHLAPRLKKK